MTQTLKNRIKRESIVDTKKYRYILDGNTGEIQRIPLSYLDTSNAWDKSNWQTIA